MEQPSRAADERMWASIAHACILVSLIPIIPGLGPVVTMTIWVFKRRRSSYVGDQALQAFIFQAVAVFTAFILAFVVFALYYLVLLVGVIYAMFGSYRSYKGEDFRYAWIGSLISSFRPRR